MIITTWNGISKVYDLVPANTVEREVAETVIDYFSYCDLFADKGFMGLQWQMSIFDQTNILIWISWETTKKIKPVPTWIAFRI